jgi:plastocyanin
MKQGFRLTRPEVGEVIGIDDPTMEGLMSLPKRLLVMLCALALVASACGGGDDETSDDGGGDEGGGSGTTVTAVDFGFNPDSVSVEAGADVELTLQNDGEATHSLTIDDAGFEIEAEAGSSVSDTLTAPDEDTSLEFHCKFHPQMTGEIVVGAGGTGAGGSGEDDTGEGDAENDDGVDY